MSMKYHKKNCPVFYYIYIEPDTELGSTRGARGKDLND